MPSIDEAKELLEEHVKDPYQRLHSLMVAHVMKAYAEELGEDEDVWFLTGLVHDLDYEEFPDEHPKKSLSWLRDKGFSEEVIHAVEAHAYSTTGVGPETPMAATLIAVDELAGFLYAYHLMRPQGFEGMKASKVAKKLKDRTFAAKVSREDIEYGVEKAELDLKQHIDFMIDVFRTAPDLEELKKEN
jgi:putative nucleotidyltransferase with HDIG domain